MICHLRYQLFFNLLFHLLEQYCFIYRSYENAFIFSQLKGKTAKMFIGLNDLQYERRFRWSDQSEVTFTNWYTRQPDNNRYREDCTEIWPYSLHKGKWNDVECRLEQGYICQKGEQWFSFVVKALGFYTMRSACVGSNPFIVGILNYKLTVNSTVHYSVVGK